MSSLTQGTNKITRDDLAHFIEQHGDDVLELLLAVLLNAAGAPSGGGAAHAKDSTATAKLGRLDPWQQVGVIEDFVTRWPEGYEYYGPMAVYETRDDHGSVRLAIGQPTSRLTLYGAERGWVSVWHVVNGRPVQQLANFLETDDFEATGERGALISGKDGARKKGFAPGEDSLLPPVYESMRVEVHRDHFNGPKARNRLAVIATDQDTDAMLDHALAHLHLRS
ncbi:MAG TPA: hypothetical protein VK721_13905 [Solirubrobacteraceae bacterium]|jgi:hypothetical protein|nr:hypothetical protein [Solirubrobacteraceae bacterium]